MTLQKLTERELMEGDLDAFQFVLAEGLGKTLGELGSMSANEYERWKAFYTYRNEMREMERKKRK